MYAKSVSDCTIQHEHDNIFCLKRRVFAVLRIIIKDLLIMRVVNVNGASALVSRWVLKDITKQRLL